VQGKRELLQAVVCRGAMGAAHEQAEGATFLGRITYGCCGEEETKGETGKNMAV